PAMYRQCAAGSVARTGRPRSDGLRKPWNGNIPRGNTASLSCCSRNKRHASRQRARVAPFPVLFLGSFQNYLDVGLPHRLSRSQCMIERLYPSRMLDKLSVRRSTQLMSGMIAYAKSTLARLEMEGGS